MRARTAPTSSSRLETGRCTKAATRIASARSRLTSGTAISVMTNCGRSMIASRARSSRSAACPRRSYSAEIVQAVARPASIGTPKLTSRRKRGRSQSRVIR